jgi:hypothetical protein
MDTDKPRTLLSNALEYSGMAFSAAGAVMIVIPSWLAFPFFLAASAMWIGFAAYHRYYGLLACHLFYVAVNLVGLWKVLNGTWH